MKMRVEVISSLLCLFILSQSTYAEDRLQSEVHSSKKNHKWLIAVGAGAGFAVGLLIGFSAFDQAINGEQKIWTSAAVGAAAGGAGGWLWANKLDKESKMQKDASQQTLLSSVPMTFHTRLLSKRACKQNEDDPSLLVQADCICPSILY